MKQWKLMAYALSALGIAICFWGVKPESSEFGFFTISVGWIMFAICDAAEYARGAP